MLSPLEDILRRSLPTGEVTVDRQQVELICRNGFRLLKLVNTLLDFSRLEAGGFSPTTTDGPGGAHRGSCQHLSIGDGQRRAALCDRLPPDDRTIFVDGACGTRSYWI